MTFYRPYGRIARFRPGDPAMDAMSDRRSSYLQPASLRSRVVSGLLAAVPTALIILMLLTVSALGPRRPESKPLIVFNLKPPPPPPERARSVVKVANASHASAPHQTRMPPLNMVILTHKDFAAADIGALPSHQTDSAPAATDTEVAQVAGTGPDGEPFYRGRWYREPTDAELAPYWPARGPSTGTAVILCRTAEKFHVEDCHEFSESPAGTGLGQTLLKASWQFLIRPNRIGDRPLIGELVSITMNFSEERVK